MTCMCMYVYACLAGTDHMCVCVCVCVRVCLYLARRTRVPPARVMCVRACVCLCACVRACVCMCVYLRTLTTIRVFRRLGSPAVLVLVPYRHTLDPCSLTHCQYNVYVTSFKIPYFDQLNDWEKSKRLSKAHIRHHIQYAWYLITPIAFSSNVAAFPCHDLAIW